MRSFDIVQNDDGYVATVVMFAPVPPNVAWDVLTDFDNMQKWVPNVKESKVAARDGNTLTVEQKGVARFGLLSFNYESARRMQLDPKNTILSTQVAGSMRRLVSLMKVSPDGAGTRLDYKLEIEPAGIAATVMSKKIPAARGHRAVHGDRGGNGQAREVAARSRRPVRASRRAATRRRRWR